MGVGPLAPVTLHPWLGFQRNLRSVGGRGTRPPLWCEDRGALSHLQMAGGAAWCQFSGQETGPSKERDVRSRTESVMSTSPGAVGRIVNEV